MLRRDFLKGAVGIAAVPLPSIGGQVSSRNRIRLGLIGCGGRMGLGIQYGILNNLCGADEEIVCMAEPPKGMDWDAWCGPAPVCDYYEGTADHNGMHPHDWHAWIGYGNGAIGNMGTHILDPAFWALRLGEVHPASVEATDLKWGVAGSWAWRNTIHWRFPARKGMDAMTLHWYDGVKDGVPYDESASAFLKTTYRPGWEIKG